MSVSMSQAIGAVRALIEGNQWKYEYSAEKQRFQLKFNLSKTKLSNCTIFISVRPRSDDENSCSRIISYGYISLSGDAESMANVCEYLTRANYGLSIGNFELDFRDGEIRYKVSCNARDALPGEDALDDLISLPILMFNRYGNGLLAVSMGMMTPEQAVEQAEST